MSKSSLMTTVTVTSASERKPQAQPQPEPTSMLLGSDELRKLFSLSMSELKNHQEFKSHLFKPSPFILTWIYGYNPRAPIINLNSHGSTICFYAACNCAVLYNWTKNTMIILQGHKHMVTCLAKDASGRWLVTADSGPENVVIVWDSTDNFPQRTLFNPHGSHRIAKVAISSDAKYLLTLAYSKSAHVHWYIWSEGYDIPHALIDVAIPPGSVVSMRFNPYKSDQFLLQTKHDIWIGKSQKIFVMERGVLKETNNYELIIYKPSKILHADVGCLTCFTFVKATCQVIVATRMGAVLIYGYTLQYQTETDYTNIQKLKFIKVLKIEHSCINVIKCIDHLIVTGNEDGQIHFYDDQMKLLYWVHGFTVDSVKGLSFNKSPRSFKIFDVKTKKMCPCWEKVVLEPDPVTGEPVQKLIKRKVPSDTTTEGKPFIVRDFIIKTNNQGILFCDFVMETYTTIMDYRPWYAMSTTIHPEKPLFCTGFKNGFVELIDFIEHKVIHRVDFRDVYKTVILPLDDSSQSTIEVIYPQISVSCIKYSPKGVHLACGLDTGQLLFLDPCTIDILTKTPFKDTKYRITIITYSPDSLVMAMADVGMTVCVYKYSCSTHEWSFVGKHRSHYKEISSLTFLPKKNPDGEWKLISLGHDRVIVQYDIGKSADECLEVLDMSRVDQSAVPLAAIPWPTPEEVPRNTCHTDLPLIFVSNDAHKYKIVNYDTIDTMATVLGPRYESPVCKVNLVTRKEDNYTRPYLLFATKSLIGLQQLPLDGNPWKHQAMLGHPNALLDMVYRDEPRILLTIGQKDCCICQWKSDFKSVDETAERGGTDLDPYYCLIENSRPGWLFQEVRDLFYYIQILCQGTFTPIMRTVSDRIPIDSLPDLMRALGFFPSQYEVGNLVREAKWKIYLKEPVSELDFEEFVKLYLNHRPAHNENQRKILKAYKLLAQKEDGNYYFTRDEFINILCDYGESFTRELAWYLLSILSGQSFEDRAQMTVEDFSFLPEEIHLSDLMFHILGVGDVELDTASSVASPAVVDSYNISSATSDDPAADFDEM